MKRAATPSRYARLLEHIFNERYRKGAKIVEFARENIEEAATALRMKLPKNLGDLIYSFRYRVAMPDSIQKRAPKGKIWVIRGVGRSRYAFAAVPVNSASIVPSLVLAETKIPDATPGVIVMYALTDEQALLAILRYNRLIDIFTGISCYSLQSHLRTTVKGMGQVETDEVYIGVDKRGAHFVIPVQAKGGNDRINIVQIEQDIAMCTGKFPAAICRPIAAQFMADDVIALFEFEKSAGGVVVAVERHYRLSPPDGIAPTELEQYAHRQD